MGLQKQYAAIRIGLIMIVSGICLSAFSQTAEQLKKRFADLLGPGKYARLVWQVEECNNRKPNFDYGGWCGTSTKIMGMDTRDGIVKILVDFGKGHNSSPAFSWDGRKVLYTDNAARKIGIVDWASGERKDLVSNFEGNGGCWQSSDGKQWYLASEAKNNGILYRININNPSEKVKIFTTTWNRAGYAGVTCWTTMSTDGKFCAGGWPNYGDLGWLDVTTLAIQDFTKENGCWPSIARDNTYDILHITSSDDAHIAIRIVGRNGTEKLRKNLRTAKVLASDQHYETLRWTSDRDYVTLCAYNGGSTFNFRNIANPILMRVSDLAAAAVVDNPTTATGNMDAYFYSSSTNATKPGVGSRESIAGAGEFSLRYFDCQGRAVAKKNSGTGVYIAATAKAVHGRTRLMIAP